MKTIHGEPVYGEVIDDQTRCSHYNSELDIIAIKFKCCGRWYPCIECHRSAADHPSQVWPLKDFDELAIICGTCGRQLTINEYLSSDNVCPGCVGKFNPGCAEHYHFYFEDGR